MPDEWIFVVHYDAGGSIYDRIKWDSVEYYNGNHSLKVTADSVSKDFYFIQNVIPTNGLQNGQKYRFSLWMKSQYGRIDVYFQDQNWDSILNLYVEDGTDWTYKEGIVTVTEDITSFQVLMEIYQPISSPSGLMEGWIDDVKLTIYSE
ncbi:MAG: carbohydrate binding domain-containing protein [Proteobacteria bacterium]|nr:carbohydrate binding domain-containing protein [Pseudomonadota bacterium]